MVKIEPLINNYKVKMAGLTQAEAMLKLTEHGSNELSSKPRTSPIVLLLNQFKDFIIMVLLFATLVSLFLGEIADAVTIIIIVLLNAILGFVQEYRTEKSLEALKELATPHALVIRDGIKREIPAKEIVPGDLLVLETGNIVPADCVLVESNNIEVNESILTGESIPVEKQLYTNSDSLKKSSIFMGTTITTGRGKAVVTATGMNSEMGNIAHMISNIEDSVTPLQERLSRIGKQLVFICLVICAVIMVAGVFHGETLFNMLLASVSLAVAAIPEGLPAVVTVALAIGVQKMLKNNALIRRLPAVETLGCTNIICSDKTGTLTENKMTVKKLFADNNTIDCSPHDKSRESIIKTNINKNRAFKMLLTIGSVCNNAEIQNGIAVGDPTEAAILNVSISFETTGSDYTRISENPFDSDRKRMSVICRDSVGDYYLFVKGAPDKVLNLCVRKLNGDITQLGATDKNSILSVNEEMANGALRVIAFAYKKLSGLPNSASYHNLEKNLVFVGLEGMIDPPRIEAIDSIKSCYRAGITPVMITGDHKNTAVAIAKELGLKVGPNGVLTGDEIDAMNDREFERRVSQVSIFARVTPKHKFRIVQSLKYRKNIVAMTGDGVNDAPALKEANIGIAMGKCGTDVAKESSAMILLDDNFATIVSAIREGRIIYDNIRKFIRYLLACNFSEILLMATGAIFGTALPLIPIQILWINLVTDGLPALALGVDPADNNIMDRPPRKNNESIFSRGLGSQIFFSGLLIGISCITAFITTMYLTNGDVDRARTVTFATMIVAELLYAFESRSEFKSIFEEGFFKNPYLVLAVLSSFALMLLVIYNPFLSSIFKTTTLTFNEWMLVGGFGIFEFAVNNINMLVNKKKM